LEHPEIGDVEKFPVGRESQGKGEPADAHRGRHLPGASVDHGDPEIGLVDCIKDAAFGIESQVARVAVVISILIEIDRTPAFAGPVEQGDPSGVPLGGVNAAFAVEGQTHKDAAPLAFVGVLIGGLASGPRHPLANVPRTGTLVLQNGQRVPPRSGIRGNHIPAGGAYG
jgi:hypothetical protein